MTPSILIEVFYTWTGHQHYRDGIDTIFLERATGESARAPETSQDVRCEQNVCDKGKIRPFPTRPAIRVRKTASTEGEDHQQSDEKKHT
jgi:hypothetical protein